MGVIIDTWNVLHVTDGAPDAAAWLDIRGLADLIGRSRFRNEQVDLVCDGAPTPNGLLAAGGREEIEVIYSGAGREADAVIEEMIAAHTAPGRLTVVSSDRRLQRAARRRRAKHMSSPDFLHLLLRDASRYRERRRPDIGALIPLSDPEVDAWLEQFELSDDLKSLRSAPDTPPRPPVVGPPPKPKAATPDAGEAVEPPPRPDPLIEEALREWPDLRPEDLDMSRWLDGA